MGVCHSIPGPIGSAFPWRPSCASEAERSIGEDQHSPEPNVSVVSEDVPHPAANVHAVMFWLDPLAGSRG